MKRAQPKKAGMTCTFVVNGSVVAIRSLAVIRRLATLAAGRDWHSELARRFALALGCLCAVTVCRVAGQSTPGSADEWLRAASASLAWNNRYESVTAINCRSAFGEKERPSFVGVHSVVKKYCDGERLHVIYELIDHLAPDGKVVQQPSRREVVFGHDSRITWWYPPKDPFSGMVQITNGAKRAQTMRVIIESDPASGGFLDGNVDGLGNIVDVLRGIASAPQLREEQLNGIKCEVVEAHSAVADATIWIAPSQGNCIAKYMLHRNDPATGVSDDEAEATSFQPIDQWIAVRSGRNHRTWIDQATHIRWDETAEADRSGLTLQPRFNKPNLFSTHSIPNGLRVLFDDMPNVGVDFVWQNGKPVPKLEPQLFDQLGLSVQRTISGEVSRTAPIAEESAVASLGAQAGVQTAAQAGAWAGSPVGTSIGGSDAGGDKRRLTQVWAVLCSAAGMTMALLGVSIRRGWQNGS